MKKERRTRPPKKSINNVAKSINVVPRSIKNAPRIEAHFLLPLSDILEREMQFAVVVKPNLVFEVKSTVVAYKIPHVVAVDVAAAASVAATAAESVSNIVVSAATVVRFIGGVIPTSGKYEYKRDYKEKRDKFFHRWKLPFLYN